jgi:beta-lactamase regulating signal transducer with metallopeptidase domain
MASELLQRLLVLALASSLGMVTALAIRRPMRHLFGAGASYALWLLVPLAMLSVLLPHVHATSSPAPVGTLSITTFPLAHALDRSMDSLAAAASAPLDTVLWTLGVWGAGAAIVAWYLLGVQRAFVKSLGTVSGLRCVLRAEHSVGCPALIGVLRPKVILPADFKLRYTRLERLLILSHERTHLRRGDAGWNALVALMRCLFWFNPLMQVAARYFRFDQELACDAAVLRARRGARRPYANAMLKTQLTEGALPIGCHWRSAQDLKERLRMVSRRAPNRRRRRFGGALTTLLAVVVAYTAWAAEPVVGSTTRPSFSASTGGRSAMRWTAAWAGWLTLPDQAPDQPVIITLHDARLFLASGVNALTSADKALSGDTELSGQTTTLEGNVHLRFGSHAAGVADPQAIMVETNRAVLFGQPGGGSVIQLDEATMQTVLPPQFVSQGTSQVLPQVSLPSRITPQFQDADISQAAAAVQLATHRSIIIDPRVRAQLTMVSTVPMTPEAFNQAFLDILRTRGFVAMPVGPAGNVIRILPGTNFR